MMRPRWNDLQRCGVSPRRCHRRIDQPRDGRRHTLDANPCGGQDVPRRQSSLYAYSGPHAHSYSQRTLQVARRTGIAPFASSTPHLASTAFHAAQSSSERQCARSRRHVYPLCAGQSMSFSHLATDVTPQMPPESYCDDLPWVRATHTLDSSYVV